MTADCPFCGQEVLLQGEQFLPHVRGQRAVEPCMGSNVDVTAARQQRQHAVADAETQRLHELHLRRGGTR